MSGMKKIGEHEGQAFTPAKTPPRFNNTDAQSPTSPKRAVEMVIFENTERLATGTDAHIAHESMRIMCSNTLAHVLNAKVAMRMCADDDYHLQDKFLTADPKRADADEAGWFHGRFVFTKNYNSVRIMEMLVGEGFALKSSSIAATDKLGVVQMFVFQRGGLQV